MISRWGVAVGTTDFDYVQNILGVDNAAVFDDQAGVFQALQGGQLDEYLSGGTEEGQDGTAAPSGAATPSGEGTAPGEAPSSSAPAADDSGSADDESGGPGTSGSATPDGASTAPVVPVNPCVGA